jgi:hypothetical protein
MGMGTGTGTGTFRDRKLPNSRLGLDVQPLDDDLGRWVGVLLQRTKARDVIDAALVLLAMDGDQILVL